MATAAALAEVPVSLRELYETEDPDYLTFVHAVVKMACDVKAEQAREASKRR